jgi:hypothetical protein
MAGDQVQRGAGGVQQRRGAAVQVGKDLRGGVPQDRVSGRGVPKPAGSEQPGRGERVPGRRGGRRLHIDHAAEQAGSGRLAVEHGEGPRHGPHRGIAAAQRVPDRVGEHVADLVAGRCPVLDQCPDQEEVATAGGMVGEGTLTDRGGRLGSVGQQAGDGADRERGEADVAAVRLGQQFGPEQRVRRAGRREHDQHSRRADVPDQGEQELQRRDVGVLLAVHADDKRPVRCDVEQHLAETVQRLGGGPADRLQIAPGQRGGQRALGEQPGHTLGAWRDGRGIVEELPHHAERHVPLRGSAGGGEHHGATCGGLRGEHAQQVGLAAADRTADGDDAAPTGRANGQKSP